MSDITPVVKSFTSENDVDTYHFEDGHRAVIKLCEPDSEAEGQYDFILVNADELVFRMNDQPCSGVDEVDASYPDDLVMLYWLAVADFAAGIDEYTRLPDYVNM
ncbi:MAG: hypothetical protein JWO54_611 [Candidatus Saccharibacteria bacterium]|nr:hypothetical protein [Candidatus Saccharibacteria bacterium]MDB5180851.1 hypothetical protein [Candidatus Saccharibacteria bacterium]